MNMSLDLYALRLYMLWNQSNLLVVLKECR